MRHSILLGLILACGSCSVSADALAQTNTPALVVTENRYLFSYQGTMDTMAEKKLIEALRVLDAEMVVAIDRPTSGLKLVARYPLNMQETVSMAALCGLTITPRREIVVRDGTYMQQD